MKIYLQFENNSVIILDTEDNENETKTNLSINSIPNTTGKQIWCSSVSEHPGIRVLSEQPHSMDAVPQGTWTRK
jgi:hypothetical protein